MAGVDTKTYLTIAESDQNIQMASLDQFKRIVIKDRMFEASNEKVAENSFKNAAAGCKRRKLHSAIYCQVCFPHNINGVQ